MSHEALDANSLVEAHLYVLVRPCPTCGHGACQPAPPRRIGDSCVQIIGVCRNCGASEPYDVRLSGALRDIDPISDSIPLNPQGRPSRILDVGHWLTLAELMLRQAEGAPDPQERLWLRHRAAECFEEALRLYPPDGELPLEHLVLADSTQTALRDHPERFLRQRLQARRADLPTLEAYEQAGKRAAGHRPWWKFW